MKPDEFPKIKKDDELNTKETTTGLDEILTSEEVASFLRVDPKTVWRLLRSGELVGSRVGDLWRVERKELEAYIARMKEKVANAPKKTY